MPNPMNRDEAVRVLGAMRSPISFESPLPSPSRCNAALDYAITALTALRSGGGEVPDGFVLIDKGALKLVENVLRRAGKEEVADEMLSAVGRAALPHPQPAIDSGLGEGFETALEWLHSDFASPQPARGGAVAEDCGTTGAAEWKRRYFERCSVISRWHERAVALGYEGVSDLLGLALPCIVNNAGDERPAPPAAQPAEAVESVERFEFGPYGMRQNDEGNWIQRDEILRWMSAMSATRCTCPSGDGSLRWPCPQHPAQPAEAGKVRELLDDVQRLGHSGFCRVWQHGAEESRCDCGLTETKKLAAALAEQARGGW